MPAAKKEAEVTFLDLLAQSNRDTLKSILTLLDPVCIAQRICVEPDPQSRYGTLMHAQLCRLKMLGFSDRTCAETAGISPATLRNWREKYTQLVLDMEQAAALASVEVVKLLFRSMSEKGMTGLNAIKFFLSTRTEEFQERTQIEVKATTQNELAMAVRALYGVGKEPDEIEVSANEPLALPIPPNVDVEEAPPPASAVPTQPPELPDL
jgi:hypothetical protein